MEKVLPKVGKHVVGLPQGEMPAEFAAQRELLEEVLNTKKTSAPSTPASAVQAPAAHRAQCPIKLTCLDLKFTLEMSVFAVIIQDAYIHVQVPLDFKLCAVGQKVRFTLEYNNEKYGVILMMPPMPFPDCLSIPFIREAIDTST